MKGLAVDRGSQLALWEGEKTAGCPVPTQEVSEMRGFVPSFSFLSSG